MTSSVEPPHRAILAAVVAGGSVDLVLAQLADPEHLVLRCAWCGRMEVESAWVAVPVDSRTVRVLHERTTHGICPDCLAHELAAGAAARRAPAQLDADVTALAS